MDLRDLYQEVILDHGKSPRNFRALAGANRRGEGYNPLCGDRIHLELEVEGDVIRDAAFQGAGCAISVAAASTMTEAIKGKSVAEARALFDQFHALVTGSGAADPVELDRLAVFEGVARYPMRVKCATLCWHTLVAALAGEPGEVRTE